MNLCVIYLFILALYLSCHMSDAQDVPATLSSEFRQYIVDRIKNYCRGKHNYNGKIFLGGCSWSQYQRERLCCSFSTPGSFCSNSGIFVSHYCYNPSSKYQTTTTTEHPLAGSAFVDGCFPSTSTVNLQTGKSVTMSELQKGDQVQTVSSDGNLTYSRVTTFLKSQHFMTNFYKTISTSWNSTIHLSENHLIYARKSKTEKLHPIYADQISIGDEVLFLGSEELTPVKVVNVSMSPMQGAHVPLIGTGNIVIDGLLASCHSSTDHYLAHLGTTPMQWYPQILKAIFGEENGTQIYVIIAAEFAGLVYPKGIMY